MSETKVEALRVEWEAAIKENKERNRALDALNRARSELTYAENVKEEGDDMSKLKVEALKVEWEAASEERNRALYALNRARSLDTLNCARCALLHAEDVETIARLAYADAIGVEATGPVKPSNRKRLELMLGPQDEE